MTKDHLLAIDVGTQSARALIFDAEGRLHARAQIPIEPYFAQKPGWAEQHAHVFWDAVGQACRAVWAQEGARKDALAGVVLTTQRGTVLNVDVDGEPLRPAISWLDQRRAGHVPQISGYWPLLFRLARATETVYHFQQQAEANWLAGHQPEVMARTHKFLLLSGWLIYKLTGRFADSVAAQVGYVPLDHRKQRWAASGHWKWQALALSQDQMPELVAPGQAIGRITRDAAEHTGIPEGLTVIAAAADKADEVLGSGCIEPQLGALSYGTTATINTTHDRYIEVIPLLPPYPSALPGRYSLEVQIFRGYWMVNWFKQEFGHPETRVAAENGVTAEKLLDELVWDVSPGSDGLVLQPYWTPGVRHPGPEARGAIVGFSDVHTRAHIYRAILEGVAYALREATERTVKRSGVPVTELRVSGGGSQSSAAMQITADVFNLPASRPHTYETSGLGAAINGAVGTGLHRDYASAVQAMVHISETFEPDAATHAVYDALYRRVYTRMYGRLRGLYHALRELGIGG